MSLPWTDSARRSLRGRPPCSPARVGVPDRDPFPIGLTLSVEVRFDLDLSEAIFSLSRSSEALQDPRTALLNLLHCLRWPISSEADTSRRTSPPKRASPFSETSGCDLPTRYRHPVVDTLPLIFLWHEPADAGRPAMPTTPSPNSIRAAADERRPLGGIGASPSYELSPPIETAWIPPGDHPLLPHEQRDSVEEQNPLDRVVGAACCLRGEG